MLSRRKLRLAFLKSNPELALWAFPDGFRLQVFAFGQGNVNYSPFLRIHRSKSKNGSGCSDLGRGMQRHCAQFSFPGGAETVNIADDPLPFGQISPKGLDDEMLQRFEQFTAFRLEQFCIPPIQVQQAPIRRLLSRDLQLKTGFL